MVRRALPRWGLIAVAAAGLVGTAVFAFLYVRGGTDSDDPLAQWKIRAVEVLLEEERLYNQWVLAKGEFNAAFTRCRASAGLTSAAEGLNQGILCARREVPGALVALDEWDALVLSDMARMEGEARTAEGRDYSKHAASALHTLIGCDRAAYIFNSLAEFEELHKCPMSSDVAQSSLSRLYGHVGLSGHSAIRNR